MTQMDAAGRDPARRSELPALEAANRRFINFLHTESYWKTTHGL